MQKKTTKNAEKNATINGFLRKAPEHIAAQSLCHKQFGVVVKF